MYFLRVFLTVFVAILLSGWATSLECYTGHSFIRGKSVGTNTEVCKKSTDKCFKASATANNAVVKVKLAGCSTIYGVDRCKFVRGEDCTTQEISGNRLKVCCCGSDLCNTKQKKSMTDNVGGIVGQLFGGGNKKNDN